MLWQSFERAVSLGDSFKEIPLTAHLLLINFTIVLGTAKINVPAYWNWVLKINLLAEFLPHGFQVCRFSSHFEIVQESWVSEFL